MPREGVPYPERVLCSLKNTIAMIEQKLGLKIEKVNGVGPDPQGNVTLVSGDSALTIEEDATQHQVTIGLDRTELPSAAVTSVNGETGAVSLDASEIPGKGANKTVMDNINTLETVGLQMRSDLNDEIIARRNADSALRANINTLQASIPSEAAAAVAADNTIVRTSGNQSIGDIKTVPTQATGSYSQQIANSEKVRNEINTYAVTTTGTQTVSGQKIFASPFTTKKIGIDPSQRVTSYQGLYPSILIDSNNNDWIRHRIDRQISWFGLGYQFFFTNNQGARKSTVLEIRVNHTTGACSLFFQDTTGVEHTIVSWNDPGVIDQ